MMEEADDCANIFMTSHERKCQAKGSPGGHHFLGLTNTDVNPKRMHQLYTVMDVG